jgi:hypothetical protein
VITMSLLWGADYANTMKESNFEPNISRRNILEVKRAHGRMQLLAADCSCIRRNIPCWALVKKPSRHSSLILTRFLMRVGTHFEEKILYELFHRCDSRL